MVNKPSKPSKPLATAAAAAASLTTFYAWWYFAKVCKAPKVYACEGVLKELLKDGVYNLWRPFHPTPWLVLSHLQTVAGVIRRIGGNIYTRELLVAEDGGTVGLDWFKNSDKPSRWTAETPIVLVMHGITGGSQEGYCRWMCTAAFKKGWRSSVLNYRGCNGVPHTSNKGYNAMDTEDTHLAIGHIKRKYPSAPLFVAAYSLGSLMLCKYLGECDSQISKGGPGSQVAGAALISCPMCLRTSFQNIETPWTIGYLFNLVLTYRLKQYAKEHKEQYGDHPNLDTEEVFSCKTMRDFEEATVCQMYGLSSLEEYRDLGSVKTHIPNVQTKCLILISDDDPFIGSVPYAEVLSNPNTALGVTERGGHVAFLQGIWPFGQGWIEDTLMQYFSVMHENLHATKPEAPSHSVKFLSSL